MASRLKRGAGWLAVAAVALASLGLSNVNVAHAATLVPVSGAGSTWSSNAMDQWIGDVNQYGIKINFAATGSSDGRQQFRNATVDFAVSEIPYGETDNGTVDPPPTNRSFSYMPIVAGGTSFMYQLHINGQQVTNLRLSGLTLAKIFTDNITNWSDPAIAADNPGIVLPARPIIPVVRADGSGTTAQLTTWLAKQYPDLWNAYCGRAGRVLPCGTTSTYPVLPGSGFIAEQQSSGVAGYVTQSQSEGTIGYIEASYAIEAGYPVAKVLNDAGYYAEPTASNVAVALTAAQINMDPTSPLYLTQQLDGVYDNPDPRAYPLSSYSYMIIPTGLQSPMTTDKGYTLGKFAYYFLCQGQQAMPQLGYSPLPINLVQAALAQVAKIPGVDLESLNIAACNNPTFSSNGTNLLATTAPQPLPCDKQAVTMCPNGTGGATAPTYVAAGAVAAAPATTPAAGLPATTQTRPPTTKSEPRKPTVTAVGKPTPGSVKTTAPANAPAGTGSTLAPGHVGIVSGAPSDGRPAPTTTTATGKSAPGASVAVGGVPPGTAVRPAAVDAAGAPAPVDADSNPGVAAAAPPPPRASGVAEVAGPQEIRAVPVSLAATTGWTLQDTLIVLAVLLCLAVTLVPPLLSLRLSRRRTP